MPDAPQSLLSIKVTLLICLDYWLELKLTEVTKFIAEEWKALSEETKKVGGIQSLTHP